MIHLPFQVEFRDGTHIKIRPDGRYGPCIADEGILWDALQEALRENAQLRGKMAEAMMEQRGQKKGAKQ